MANSMSLPIPVVGVDTGPNWANAINNCLALIAEHTHASGSGVQITPTGLNINAPLLFNGNPLQSAAYLNMLPQGTGIPVPINGSLYMNGVNLYFRDGAGVLIPITQGGQVIAGSTGIISGAASAIFNGLSIFQIFQDTALSVRAHVDASSYSFKYNGSYQTPPLNSVVLQAPTSIAGPFSLTLPTGLPGVNNAIMAGNTVGQLTFITSDTVATGMTATGADTIATTMSPNGANTIANKRTRSTGTAIVGIGGVAVAGITSFSTSSGTLVDIPGLSVQISSTGRPIMIMLVANNDAVNPSLWTAGGSAFGNSASSFLALLRGGVRIGGSQMNITIQTGTPQVSLSVPGPTFSYVDVIGAGTYIYKMQISAGNYPVFVSQLRLVAYEL